MTQPGYPQDPGQGQQYQQQWQPPPQQPQQPWSPPPGVAEHPIPHHHKEPGIMKLVKGNMFGTLIFVGVVLILLGAIMIHMAPQVTNYNHDPPSDADDLADNAATQRMMGYVGSVFADLGMFLVAGLLLLAALFRTDFSDTIRFGIFFAVGLMLFAVGFRL